MKDNEKLHKVGFEADEVLYNGLQAARAAGSMYNGKRFSNRLGMVKKQLQVFTLGMAL